MINHKILWPSIYGMMTYKTTHLSLNLLVKEFLKLVNIWQSYRQNFDCFVRPTRTVLLSSMMLISPDKLNNACITDRNCYQLTSRCYVNRQINVS